MPLRLGLLSEDHSCSWEMWSTLCMVLSLESTFCISVKLLLENYLESLATCSSLLVRCYLSQKPWVLTSLSEQKFFEHYCADLLPLTWALSAFSFSSKEFHFAQSSLNMIPACVILLTINSFCFEYVKRIMNSSLLDDWKLNICDWLKAIAVHKTITKLFL